MANRRLGVYGGKSSDGELRESTSYVERPVSHDFLDGISCDPASFAAESLHRPHKPKTLRLSQTGGVTAEEKLTATQKRWLEALEGDDPEAKEKAKAETLAWMREKHLAEQADIDASLAEMGYDEDSIPRSQPLNYEGDDEYEYGIFPLDVNDDYEDYLSPEPEGQTEEH